MVEYNQDSSLKIDWQQAVFFAGLALLFLIVPFYGYPNLGTPSLAIPNNTSAWSVVSWLIALGLLSMLARSQIQYPKLWLYFTIFPVTVILVGLSSDTGQPITWLFRQLFLLGGGAFLLALYQFQPKQYIIDRILFIIVISTGLHALVGTVQIMFSHDLPLWFPPSTDSIPRGMFQQINVHASFLVTGQIISLYLMSRPNFRHSSVLVKLILVIAFALAMYIVTASGSRVGLLGIVIGMPLILWSRYHQLKHYKKLLAIILIASSGAVFLGQAGLHITIDKTAKLSERTYATARVAMYTIGLELVAKKPLYGHGIGSFRKVWNQQSSDFINRHPEAVLPRSVGHPHNELLFWMIEGGLLAVAGIIAAIIGIILALIRCGFQRGGAYAAMLLPISLHTQVELPFYISAVHWFLWLFIIFLILRHQTKVISINLSNAATRLIQASALFLAMGVTVFMFNTARAQTDLFNFLYQPDKAKQPYLQLALNNLYFKTLAEQVAMRSMLYDAIKNNNREKVVVFENWALDYVSIDPKLNIYEDLISASIFLRPEGKGCEAIKAGLDMYAHNVSLKKVYKKNCAME